MPTQLECVRTGPTLTIRIRGRFDYTAHRDFREAYEAEDLSQARIVIDMAHVEHLDSSALGMLLVLREKAGAAKASIAIRHCTPALQKLFRVANFQKMFDIS